MAGRGASCELSLSFPTRGSILVTGELALQNLASSLCGIYKDWQKVNIFPLNLIWTFKIVLASTAGVTFWCLCGSENWTHTLHHWTTPLTTSAPVCNWVCKTFRDKVKLKGTDLLPTKTYGTDFILKASLIAIYSINRWWLYYPVPGLSKNSVLSLALRKRSESNKNK